MNPNVTKLTTANDLLAMLNDGFRHELVKGELVRMPPTGPEHGIVTMHIAAPLYRHVRANLLGEVYAAETGFVLHTDPDTVRAPDVAFVSQERIEATGQFQVFFPGAPDLAVEVVSADDKVRGVQGKVADWLATGSSIVWVISPQHRTVTVHCPLKDASTLTESDTLSGEDLVPGFKILVADILGLSDKDQE